MIGIASGGVATPPPSFTLQVGQANGASISTLAVTLGGTLPIGCTVIVAVRLTTGHTVSSITDTAGTGVNTWHRDAHVAFCEQWRCHLSGALTSGTVTLHFSASTTAQATAGKWINFPNLTAPDASNTASSPTGATHLTVTLTAGAASDFWVGAVGITGTRPTVTTSLGTRRCFSRSVNGTVGIMDYTPGTVGPHTNKWTWGT